MRAPAQSKALKLSMPPLFTVPKVTLLHIMGYLALGGIMGLRAVCREWLRVLHPDEKIWKDVRPADLLPTTVSASAAGLHFLNRLYSISGQDVGKELTGADSALGAACWAGDLAKIEWLTHRFTYPFGALAESAECAVRHGHIKVLMYMSESFSIMDNALVKYPFFLRMLYAALFCGQCNIVMWLLKFHSPTNPMVMPRDIISVFRAACQGPNRNCLPILAGSLRITKANVHLNERVFLGDACFMGRTASALWLIQQYGLSALDLRRSHYVSIQRACERNFYHLALTIIHTLQINISDLYQHLPRQVGELLWHYMRCAEVQKKPTRSKNGAVAVY